MDKKHEMLEAGFDLFCEKGYHLSMPELAEKVELKTPSLYSHFRSKDQILTTVIQEEIQCFYYSLKEKMIAVEKMGCKEFFKAYWLGICTNSDDKGLSI